MKHVDDLHHDDPEFLDLRREFVREAIQRTREMAVILEATRPAIPADTTGSRFRKLAHDLRGAGGSYGFPIVTLYAGEVEDTYLDAGNPEALAAIVHMLDGAVRQAGSLVGIPELPR